ncbi:ATP-dependent helicase HrpB [Anditalea andensis]|uniref:DEAD/DEAH box helicase n=1 Tax=Anditalea andensis TaxID=1048983 RepID=A0A074KVI1_9BACT|nr:ATP-dependent helicase HrpB [Anditalea andensis]KEO73986.1 DEAD/DEAH box helicase [Anditalea andensis]
MTFDHTKFDLPIVEVVAELKAKLAISNTLILNAPTGAGKSTLLPLALMEETWLEGKKILMLEPRRLATKSIAMRMSQLLDDPIGQQIGYMIRFENRTSAHTKITVLTEGILTRMLHSDNALTDIGLVIFDEFHERNIHADVAMALCRETQQILRPDLRILVMSATLDMPQLSSLLDADIVESKGKQYPVDIKYLEDTDPYMIPEAASRAIINAVKTIEGDVLAFLPGQGEILQCEKMLRSALPDFAINTLYGQLSFQKQQQAILPHKTKRKVVLATSIAETSLTIEGVTIVVDCGYGRTSKFDPKSGLTRLETIQITKDAADQRAGRAGRIGPGICFRLWTKATHEKLAPFRTPEILEADLAPLVLDMAKWGIQNVAEMTWLNPPSQGALAQAAEILQNLEAMDEGKLTPHGHQIHQLACHPRIAHMLIRSKEQGTLHLAIDIAGILEEKDPMEKGAGVDLNIRIEELRRLRKAKNVHGRFRKIETVAASYRRIFGIEEDNAFFDVYETGVLLAYAYPERIACARPGNNAQFQLSNGKLAMIGHKDDLAHEPWLAVAHVDARDGMGKIFLAAPINPKDLAPMVKEKDTILWDTKKAGLIAKRELRIGGIILQSKPLPAPDESQKVSAISQAIRSEGVYLLDFNERVIQWQNRINSLRIWNPAEDWPDVSTTSLLQTNEQWLAPYLIGVKSADDLKRLDLVTILNGMLTYEQQTMLNDLAPAKTEVPSGSQIVIKYMPDGERPVLAVRLQEVFGMMETPKINRGKNPVVMHLLSPGFKPVQVTSDLRSFWQNTYFEVKKELKRRYPKHSWPEDPYKAVAIRGVNKK